MDWMDMCPFKMSCFKNKFEKENRNNFKPDFLGIIEFQVGVMERLI